MKINAEAGALIRTQLYKVPVADRKTRLPFPNITPVPGPQSRSRETVWPMQRGSWVNAFTGPLHSSH